MSSLTLATDEHYPGRVSQRTIAVMSKIKAKFNALGLSQRTTTCPFRQFFLAPDLKFFEQTYSSALTEEY